MTERPVLATTRSGDGTRIAYWRSGRGPALVLVHGTTADHSRWERVLPLLEPRVTVHAMDRRGRGASGDQVGYSLELEAADVAAVVDDVAGAVGGPVDVLGHSYGAHCVLEAMLLTGRIRRAVLYEPAVFPMMPTSLTDELDDLLARGRREEVVVTLLRYVGMSQEQLARSRSGPSWPARVATAHTIVREQRAEDGYRFRPQRFAALAVPTLLLAGSQTLPELAASTAALAAALPAARVVTLAGHGHVAMLTAPELFCAEVLAF